MKLFSPHQRTVLTALCAAIALSACIVAPPRAVVYRSYPVYAQAPPPAEVVMVDVAPPPPQVEIIPVAPFYGAVWVGGFWGWSGGLHAWTPGHYIQPVAGHRFVPHAWVNVGGRWSLRGGFWAR